MPHSQKPPERCSTCGVTIPAGNLTKDAHNRINELETTVRMLTCKASAACDKLADYEEEIGTLRRESMATKSAAAPDAEAAGRKSNEEDKTEVDATTKDGVKALPPIPFSESPEPDATPTTATATRPGITAASRLPSFLSSSSRKSSSSPAGVQPQAKHSQAQDSISRNEADLLTILSREQTLRQEAEARLENVNTELEELSASLFQQANEMVAEERRARSKLEQRAATLEEKVKVLEKRDSEKRKRLDRLESAILRIDRVRGLLGEGLSAPPPKYEEG